MNKTIILAKKKQKLLFSTFILMNILNFGNYSFLTYTIDGIETGNQFLQLVKNVRVIIPSLLILYLLRNEFWKDQCLKLLNKNTFIFLLCFVFFLNSFISNDILESLIYSLWLFSSLLIIGLTVELTNYVLLFNLLKKGSFITLLLVIPSIPQLLSFENDSTFFSSKNYYAYPLLIYFLSEVSIFYLSKINKYIYIRIIILILILVALFLSGRRSSLICALIGLIFFFYSKSKFLFFLVISITIFFSSNLLEINFLGFSIDNSSTYKRINRFSSENYEDSSIEERKLIWDVYLKAYYDSPIIGNGIKTQKYTMKKYGLVNEDDLGYHNTFLQILVESGAFGILLFGFFFIKATIRLSKNFLVLTPLFISTIIVNLFESNLLPGQVFFVYTFVIWFMLKSEKFHKYE